MSRGVILLLDADAEDRRSMLSRKFG